MRPAPAHDGARSFFVVATALCRRNSAGEQERAMKVLVVEDDPRISDVLEYALKAEGHDVQKAQRGREAIEIAARSDPGLIVLDVGLPDIDGFEVCRAV